MCQKWTFWSSRGPNSRPKFKPATSWWLTYVTRNVYFIMFIPKTTHFYTVPCSKIWSTNQRLITWLFFCWRIKDHWDVLVLRLMVTSKQSICTPNCLLTPLCRADQCGWGIYKTHYDCTLNCVSSEYRYWHLLGNILSIIRNLNKNKYKKDVNESVKCSWNASNTVINFFIFHIF